MAYRYSHFDPLLEHDSAETMLRIAEAFGSFGTYAEEATSDSLGESLPQRFDVGLNYVAQGLDGRGNLDSKEIAPPRTNYFRETYAYGDELLAPAIEPFFAHQKMQIAAQDLSACPHVVPAIVYANILIPGQELAIHTDVPEFRGAHRKNTPQWLLVSMLHSGLFDAWRIPIITCVSWFGSATGGAFTFYPDGPSGPRTAIPAAHNTAIILDTDRVFHGVERVEGERAALPAIEAGTRLCFDGDGRWLLKNAGTAVADYHWDQLRYSISWKGYGFASDAARGLWESHSDDLTLDRIIGIFEGELRSRGQDPLSRSDPDNVAKVLVNTFVKFPQARVKRH